MQLAPNRAYINWEIPADPDGYAIGRCGQEKDYQIYLTWLAEYLYNTDITVPLNQIEVLSHYLGMDTDSAVFWLSEDWGSGFWNTVGIIEHAIEQGKTYRQYHRQELREWRGLAPEYRKQMNKEGFFITEADYKRVEEEYYESRNVPDFITHADIPYRAVLAALLKKVPDVNERIRLLDHYFLNFNDTSAK